MSRPTLQNILTDVPLNEAPSRDISDQMEDSMMLLSPDFSNIIYTALTTPPGSATFEYPPSFPWNYRDSDEFKIDEDIN